MMGLSPSSFWSLRLVEWRWLNDADAPPALDRGALDHLIALYPDETP